MAANSLNDIIAALTTDGRNQHPSFSMEHRVGNAAATQQTAGRHYSFWRLNKTNGANGATPVAAGICDRNTIGALPTLKFPTEGRKLYMTGWEGMAGFCGVLYMADRLLQSESFSGTDTSEKIIDLQATRNTSGEGNEIWLEVYGTLGTSSTTCTVKYYNQDGVLKTAPLQSIGGSAGGAREEGSLFRVPLADGDTGVKGVYSAKLTGSTGLNGGWGVVMTHPITMALCESTASAFFRDYISGTPIMPEIDPSACIFFGALTSLSNGFLRMTTMLHIVEM